MFQRIRELASATTTDAPNTNRYKSQVEQCSSEYLVGANWDLNLQLCDTVNLDTSSPNPQDRVCRALRARLGRVSNNPKCQMLILTVLEALVLNCGSKFHSQLPFTELWVEVQRMADPKRRVDLMVRDKVLCLIADWRALQPPQFAAFYQHLLDKGVRFPLRSAAELAPMHMAAAQPPSSYPPAAPTGSGPAAVDPAALQELSSEDRAAVMAAMGDLSRQQTQQQSRASQAPAASQAQSVLTVPVSAELSEAEVEKLMSELKTASGNVSLLSEVLSTIPEGDVEAAKQSYVQDIARQCVAVRPQLEQLVQGTTHQGVLAASLTLVDELDAVVVQYRARCAPLSGSLPASSPQEGAAAEGGPPAGDYLDNSERGAGDAAGAGPGVGVAAAALDSMHLQDNPMWEALGAVASREEPAGGDDPFASQGDASLTGAGRNGAAPGGNGAAPAVSNGAAADPFAALVSSPGIGSQRGGGEPATDNASPPRAGNRPTSRLSGDGAAAGGKPAPAPAPATAANDDPFSDLF